MPTKTNRKVKEIAKEVRTSIQGIITKRLKAMEGENARTSYDDLLGVLLESHLTQIKEGENKNLGMSMEEVIEECEFFHFAGHESTSVLIMWALILLSKHLDWQERAREEILQVLGGQKPDFDVLSRLKMVSFPPFFVREHSLELNFDVKLAHNYIICPTHLDLGGLGLSYILFVRHFEHSSS